MNQDLDKFCVPIINFDSEGKNIICYYKSLEMIWGKAWPALHYKPFIIKIISFINGNMIVKRKDYKESKLE